MSELLDDAIGLSQLIRTGKSPIHGEGMSAKFARINDDWGVKLYHSASSRDRAYSVQTEAAKFQLGPETAGTFDLPKIVGADSYRFGYITQLVDELLEDTLEEDYYSDDKLQEEFNDFDDYVDDFTAELRKELRDSIGFHFYDAHEGNIGYLNGRLVCIDFAE